MVLEFCAFYLNFVRASQLMIFMMFCKLCLTFTGTCIGNYFREIKFHEYQHQARLKIFEDFIFTSHALKHITCTCARRVETFIFCTCGDREQLEGRPIVTLRWLGGLTSSFSPFFFHCPDLLVNFSNRFSWHRRR